MNQSINHKQDNVIKLHLKKIITCRDCMESMHDKYRSSIASGLFDNWVCDIMFAYSLGLDVPINWWVQKMDDSDPFLMAYANWFNQLTKMMKIQERDFSINWDDEFTRLAFNALIEIFDSSNFLMKLDSSQRLQEHNTTSMVRRVCGFKARHSKLMIVRLDVGFSLNPPELEIGSKSGHKVLTDNLDLLVKSIRADYSYSYIHHEAKLEYSQERGLHAHLLFLFNGSVVREDETIGFLIAQRWRAQFHADVGWAYNDNNPIRKAQLKPYGLALGVFNEDSPQFVANVCNAVRYMAKPDHLLRLAFPGIRRAMRSAHIDQTKWERKMKATVVRQRMRKMGL
ncbi:inovirus-type Gp2 protein [Lampropedia puyangensis]|nr:inovirus-type Gp2 protein [Lampropedia puyangensis]